jgi:membrane protease YdiL (CAAX protease family)
MIDAVVYLLAIVFAEMITVFIDPMAGIVIYFIILLAAVIQPALNEGFSSNRLIIAIALVPLVRIISLSMPLVDIPQIWWYPIIYLPLLLASIVVIRLFKYRRHEIGISWGSLPVQLIIGLTGLGFGVVEYYILKPEPIITELTLEAAILPAFLLIITTGMVEELMFRGVLQRVTTTIFGNWGIVYISLLFAILHIGFLSLIDVGFVFLVALFFGWMVKKTGSLFGVILSHGIANVTLFIVAPFVLG